MNILIFGGGAVGLGLASCLLKSGNRVDIVGREEMVSAISLDGLVRTGLFGEYHVPPFSVNALTGVDEVDETKFDYILICTKSFDTQTAAETLAAAPGLRTERTQFVLCQNGWGNAETFAAFFPTEQIKNARIITGFRKPQPNEVNITVHADTVHLGSLYDDDLSPLEPLARAIQEGGLPCAVKEHIGRDLWAKMLYNGMLNGLSTLFGVPYGHLGDNDHTRKLMNGIATEIFSVMKASGFETHWQDVNDYLSVFYDKFLPPTYQHEPSMLQDVRANKRTEIDALNGQVVALGHKRQVPTPLNEMITHMIYFLEDHHKRD